MAARKSSRASQSARSKTARGEAVARTTAGGTPVGATGASVEELTTQDRLAKQREVAAEKAVAADVTQAAAERVLGNAAQTDGIFTVASRNGLPHRRNGILFGDEPVTVDISGWTEEQKQRFFNDAVLMIVPGRQLGARGALLAPARSFPPNMLGGAGENATPAMLDALNNGQAMAHPASGAASPVVGAVQPNSARQLERVLNETIDEDES